MDRKIFRKKGLKEYLLCESCEAFINTTYEQPFKKYWYDSQALPSPVPPPAPGRKDVIQIAGFGYTTFKLFHLSILWRASVAAHDAFNAVSLGPYQEKLKQMLLNKDPGPVNHYPMWGGVLLIDLDKRKVAHDLVTNHQMRKVWGPHVYFACYAGCEWYFAVTDHATAIDSEIRPKLPQLDGTMLLTVDHWDQSATGKLLLRQAAKMIVERAKC